MGALQTLQRLFSWPVERRAKHLRLGSHGEVTASRYLRRQGYRILAHNVHVGRHDEIDIVAYDPMDDTVVFVEVKTRAAHDPDYIPELNLTPEKRHRISRAARRWVSQRGFQGGYRLDFICIAAGEVTAHYKDIAWG